MDLSKLDVIEPIILPEENLIMQRDDLYDTVWNKNPKLLNYLHELEITIDFESIKDDLFNCTFSREISYNYLEFSLLTILYLADNTKYVNYKIIDGVLKINVFSGILEIFYNICEYYPCCLWNKNKNYIEKVIGKGFDTYLEDYDELDFFNDNKKIVVYRAINNVFGGPVLGIFMWLDMTKTTADEMPIVKTQSGYNIDPNKIKRIKVFNNYGFYIQLNTLTFDQIKGLRNYNVQESKREY